MSDKREVPELEKLNKEEDPEHGESEKEAASPFRRQLLVSCGTVMLTLGAGATSGYSAVLLPQLEHESGIHLNRELVSWVAAMSSLPLFVGNLISGYLMERFGRRYSQLMLSIPFVAGWIIIGFASNIYLILLGRFLTGFCQGWLGPLGPVFVGEISTPKYRGFLLASLSLSIAVGVFASHAFGTFLHWKIAAILCGLFPLTGYIIFLYSPETPSWLASKGRVDECIKSFQWYRGKGPEAKTELDKMLAQYTRREADTESAYKKFVKNLNKPEFWKPLGIMTVFFIITQLTGVNVICSYTATIMKPLIHGNSSEYVVMLSVDVLRCAALVCACVVLRKVGRRPLALVSGTLTALSLMSLALYLYLLRISVIKHLSPIVTLGLMSFYIAISNLGIVPLPWNMVGETFPVATRGIGSGISVMMTSLAFFTTVKTAPALFEDIGYDGTYLFYGLSTLLGTIFLYFFLPETKGKTLLQVEEYFRQKKGARKSEKVGNA